MAVETYSPKKVSVIFGAVIVTGFAEGTFINIERNKDAFTLATGADGEVSRIHSPDKSGKVTITLQQTSDSNDLLSVLAIADENTLQGQVPLLVKDGNGRTLVAAANAWIDKLAPSGFGDEMSTREWIVSCAELEIFVGGND